MEHTYLRYECADAFGLTTSGAASSKAPLSNSTLSIIPGKNILLATAASQCIGFSLRKSLPTIKLGHVEATTPGTGRALNSDEVVCLDVISLENNNIKVATGWVDGSVRVFDVYASDLDNSSGLVRSLLSDDNENYDFITREPLLLNGHGCTPVRSIAFDRGSSLETSAIARLGSGASDGSLLVWDVVSETGLFRLLGHTGAITDLAFVSFAVLDGLVSSSLDGLVKVWDLKEQCCTQTIANHRGEVWGSALINVGQHNKDAEERWRLVTGSTEGQVRVWSLHEARHLDGTTDETDPQQPPGDSTKSDEPLVSTPLMDATMDENDVCRYMGFLLPPPNFVTSSERVSSIHFHPNKKYVGVLHFHSKQVHVYSIKSATEAQKKRQRRLGRKREKQKLKNKNQKSSKGRKRGILDDDDEEEGQEESQITTEPLDPNTIRASDEFEYYGTIRASHKIRGFTFVPTNQRKCIQIACALSTNTVEVHALFRRKQDDKEQAIVVSEKASTLDMYGHPTGIRAIALSSDDMLACTVSKNVTKIWNVANRSCLQSLTPSPTGSNSCYGLCAIFLPGNTHVVLGTREGHLFILDIASGDVVYTEENAHDGAIWSMDLRRATPTQETISIVTGSADKTIKFWDVEAQEEEEEDVVAGQHPMLVHTRTLQMADDVVAVRYSHSTDPAKRKVFASTLDCTIRVFFDDTLKFFLSLYGHKLPALAVDASDDDVILASSGADKAIKIWGLDFGDTHRTLYGHEDSITDLRFVRRTHNFFTTSKDGTVRYWDGDRFEQILLLHGHCAEVNCLAVSRTGAFVLSGGMDRQVRVWERTKDIVFLGEERERELEKMFDKVDSGMGDDGGTANILKRKQSNAYDEDDMDDKDNEDQPQSEAAVKRSVLSVSSGDRIMEALERADQELKDIAAFRKSNDGKARSPNPLLLGLEPAQYVLRVLRSVKSAELEQSLLVLPLSHMERLVYYLIVLLKSGRGVEICSRLAVFMIKTHQNQIVASGTMAVPLRELKRLVRMRLEQSRDTVGFNLAALRAIAKVANDRKNAFVVPDQTDTTNIWAGLGLGSDVAAALEGRGSKNRR